MSEQERVAADREASAKIRATAEKNVEAIENEVLGRIFNDGEKKIDESVARADGADAAVKKNEVADARSGAATESESTESDETAESDPEWDKACTALALDGVTPAMLAKLDRTEVIELASKAKERHAKTAQELKARAERIKQLESAGATKGTEAASPTVKPNDPDAMAALREQFGDELAAPLAKLLEASRAEDSERLRLMEGLLEKQLMATAKASLRERFPQVDDPDKFDALRAEMRYHVGKHRDAGLEPDEAYQAAMRDAARVVFFDDVQASEAGKALASYRKRISSQPTPPTGKPSPQKAMTPAEREDALLEAIFKGDDEAKERLMRAV